MAREKEIQLVVDRLKKTGWLLVDELPISRTQIKEMLKSGKVICVVVGRKSEREKGVQLVHEQSFNDYLQRPS